MGGGEEIESGGPTPTSPPPPPPKKKQAHVPSSRPPRRGRRPRDLPRTLAQWYTHTWPCFANTHTQTNKRRGRGDAPDQLSPSPTQPIHLSPVSSPPCRPSLPSPSPRVVPHGRRRGRPRGPAPTPTTTTPGTVCPAVAAVLALPVPLPPGPPHKVQIFFRRPVDRPGPAVHFQAFQLFPGGPGVGGAEIRGVGRRERAGEIGVERFLEEGGKGWRGWFSRAARGRGRARMRDAHPPPLLPSHPPRPSRHAHGRHLESTPPGSENRQSRRRPLEKEGDEGGDGWPALATLSAFLARPSPPPLTV